MKTYKFIPTVNEKGEQELYLDDIKLTNVETYNIRKMKGPWATLAIEINVEYPSKPSD